MSKPLFVLVAGVNGSGKSTFTSTFKRHYPNIEVIDPDAIALGLTGSFATIDKVGGSAGRKALDQIKSGLIHIIVSKWHPPISYSTTFTSIAPK